MRKNVLGNDGLRLLLVAALALSVLGMLPSYPIPASGGCNFQLTVSPTSGSVVRGTTTVFSISIKSSCGTDHIGWGPSVTSPTPKVTCDKNNVCTSNGPLLHQSTYHTIGSGSGTFTATATDATLLTTWTITVTASDVTHCCVVRSVNVFLTVTDFMITANPTSAKVSSGQTATSTITTTGVNGFSGTIYYSVNMPSATTTGLACNLQPSSVTLSSAVTSAASTLTCSGTKGSYTVIVTGTPYSGVPSRSASVSITVG